MNFGSDLKKVEGIEIKGCPQRSTHHISNIHCDIGCPILIPLTFILMCFNLPRALRIWLSQQLQCLILVWISFVYKDYSWTKLILVNGYLKDVYHVMSSMILCTRLQFFDHFRLISRFSMTLRKILYN